MTPWRWTVDMVYGKALTGFKYPASAENLKKMMPFFFSDFGWIGNLAMIEKIVAGIVDSVKKAEEKFDQAFGGWLPASNQFGIAPLRPQLIGCLGATQAPATTGGRWVWTDGTATTYDWTADDVFVEEHQLLTDELIMIYGYFNLEPVPNIIEIFIQPGSEKFPIWNLEQMRVGGQNYLLFPEPIIIEPRSSFAISCSTKGGAVAITEEAGLLGYQFCPKAKLITKRPTT
jgi:hypothetical protein